MRVIYDNILHGIGDHALLADSFVIILAGSDLKYHALRFFAPWQPMLVLSAVGGVVSLLRFDWHVHAERRAALAGLGLGVAFVGGLYLLGCLLPPFPDTAQILSSQHWSASATADKEQAALAIDGSMTTGWKSTGALPVGARFKVDFHQLSRLDGCF